MGAPTPLDPLAPIRDEEEFIHSYFNAEPYWESEEEEEVKKEKSAGKEPSDSVSAKSPKPVGGASIEDLTLESGESG